MNQGNLQQPEKKLGIVKQLLALGMLFQASELLTNGGRSPIPTRILNQRQRRKRAAQTR